MNLSKEKKRTIILLGIVALALLLRLFRLAHQSLWLDEVMRINLASHTSFIDLLKGNYAWDSQPPFYLILLHFWLKISHNTFWIRLLSVLFGVASVPAIYFLGERLFSKKIGLLAAFLLAISAFHIWHSQDANMYSLLMLFAILSIYSTILIFQEDKFIWYIAYLISSGLGLYTHYYFSGLIIALNLFMFIFFKQSKCKIRNWILLQIALGIIIIPDFYYFFELTKSFYNQAIYKKIFSLWAFPYTFFLFATGYSLGPSVRELQSNLSILFVLKQYFLEILISGLIFLVLSGAGFLKLIKSYKKEKWGIIIIILFIPVIFAILGNIFVFPKYNVRYVSTAFPAFCILLASGLLFFRKNAVRFLMLFLLIGIDFYSLYGFYFNPKYFKEDSKSAAAYIKSNMNKSDAIIVTEIKEPFEYYFGRKEQIYGIDRKSTRLNSSHTDISRMPSSA